MWPTGVKEYDEGRKQEGKVEPVSAWHFHVPVRQGTATLLRSIMTIYLQTAVLPKYKQ